MENPGVQGWPDRATLTNRQGLFITHEPIGLSMLTVGFEYMADIIDNLIQHVVHCLIIFDLPVTIQKVIFEFTIQTIRSCTLLWIWEFCYIEEIEFLTYKIFFLGSSPILRSIPLALKPFNGMTILFPPESVPSAHTGCRSSPWRQQRPVYWCSHYPHIPWSKVSHSTLRFLRSLILI